VIIGRKTTRKYWGCSKILFIAYDVWGQSEGIGLKIDALLMRLEATVHGFTDLKNLKSLMKPEEFFDILSFYQVNQIIHSGLQTHKQGT
jgi:hypothetical protein